MLYTKHITAEEALRCAGDPILANLLPEGGKYAEWVKIGAQQVSEKNVSEERYFKFLSCLQRTSWNEQLAAEEYRDIIFYFKLLSHLVPKTIDLKNLPETLTQTNLQMIKTKNSKQPKTLEQRFSAAYNEVCRVLRDPLHWDAPKFIGKAKSILQSIDNEFNRKT